MNRKVSMGTLLRHEWRLNGSAVWGMIAVQAALLMLHSILGHLLVNSTNSLIGTLVYILHILSMVASFALAVVICVLLVASYYNSMHGKYAFFTASVPVHGSKHLWVKALYAWVALLFAMGLSILNLIVGVVEMQGRITVAMMSDIQVSGISVEMGASDAASGAAVAGVSDFAGGSASDAQIVHGFEYVRMLIGDHPSITALIVLGALLWAAGMVSGVAFILTAGSSQRMRTYGTAGGIVLTGITVWAVTQVMTVALTVCVPLALKRDFDAWGGFRFATRPFGSMEAVNEIPLGIVIAEILFIAVFMCLAARQLNKKLSL